MSDDTTRAILAAVQSGDMAPSIAADLIGKMGTTTAAPEATPEAPEAAPLTAAQQQEQAAQQFLAQLQTANSKGWVSLPVGD